jgi:hypothetical protein
VIGCTFTSLFTLIDMAVWSAYVFYTPYYLTAKCLIDTDLYVGCGG